MRTKIVKKSDLSSVLKSIVRGDKWKTTAKKLVKIGDLKIELENLMLKELDAECKDLCSLKEKSVLRIGSYNLENDKFSKILDELKQRAPRLLNFLCSVSGVNDNKIVVMAAVILKARNQHMSALHHIIGQILDYGGATDETINILNNLGLSIGAQSVYLKKADLVKQQKAKIKTIAIDPTKKSELQSKLDVSEKALKPVEKQTDTKPICFPPKLEDHAPLHDQERASFEQGKTNLLNIDNNLSVSGMSYTLCCPQVDVVDSNESSNKVADASDLNDLKAKRIETKSGFIQFPSVQSCISTEEFSDYTSANLQKSQKIYQMCLDRNSTILESPLTRFEIIGDNIDLNVSPSSMSTEKRTKSLHWFLNVALTRRILSSLPNDQPKDDILRTPNGTFLPDPDDCKHLDTNMVHHIATVLCRHVPLFMKFKKAIPEYISHPFVEELSKKSEFRIADLLDKSENKTDEMITILEHIHQYYVAQTDSVPPAVIERLVFGGDVLTNERAYSAQLAMINGETDADRLAGVVHRPEGLYRMMNLLTVSQHR